MRTVPTGLSRSSATVSGSSESSDLGTTTTRLTQGLAALDLPDGVTVRIGGVSQQQQESFAQLGLAMLVAIAVVYLIMVATFGSLLQPLLLLISIPFAATGARILGLTAKELATEMKGRALISVCTAGGQGVAAIVERAV